MGYTGSVDLVSGIRPKNNGTFPLVDAKDVRVDDNTRLDAALANASQGAAGAVRFDTAQTLTDEQKQQARDNIGTGEVDDTLSVEGMAADAKKTGDEITTLKGDLSEINKTLYGSAPLTPSSSIANRGMSRIGNVAYAAGLTGRLYDVSGLDAVTIKAAALDSYTGTPIVYVFTSAQSINAMSTSTNIGEPHTGPIDSIVSVPDEAVSLYLVVESTDTTSSVGVPTDNLFPLTTELGVEGSAIDSAAIKNALDGVSDGSVSFKQNLEAMFDAVFLDNWRQGYINAQGGIGTDPAQCTTYSLYRFQDKSKVYIIIKDGYKATIARYTTSTTSSFESKIATKVKGCFVIDNSGDYYYRFSVMLEEDNTPLSTTDVPADAIGYATIFYTDKTLSIPDKAADAKITGTRLDSLDSQYASLKKGKITFPLSWVQGWYNGQGTYSTGDTHRFCTSNFIEIDQNATLYIGESLPDYTLVIVYFKDDKSFDSLSTVDMSVREHLISSVYKYCKLEYYKSDATIDDAANINVYRYMMSDDGVVARNKNQEVVVSNFSQSRSVHLADSYSPLEFIHFSDVHRQPVEWKNICDYMDAYSKYIPFALHTGDYVLSYQAQYKDLYNVKSPSNGYILNCVGNHDVYSVSTGLERATKAETYALLFNHISDWGVTFGPGDNNMYYYKDFVDSGIRLIVLDMYYWDSTEETWFRNLLDDAITNNLAVITATHIATRALPVNKRVECTFNSLDETGTASTGEADTLTVIDDIIVGFKTGGGTHICNLCGHYHRDIVGYSVGDVLNIAVECATHLPAGWDDGIRDPDTKARDAFNVIAADRSTGTIRIARIGNNSDWYGRPKNVLCYDYVNKRVITNY